MLVYIFVLLIVGIPSIPAVKAPAIACSPLEIAACAFLVDADRVSNDGLAVTEEGLDERCKQSQPILKCFHDIAVRCPGGDLEPLKTFFIKEYTTFSRICKKDDSLRKLYLENAKCLNKHKKETAERCGDIFYVKDTEKLTKEFCGVYARNFQCTFKDVKTTCGEVAVDLVKELFTPVTSLMNAVCSSLQSSVLKYLPQFSNQLY